MNYSFAAQAVRELHAAGVPILAGDDAPLEGTVFGASIHQELQLLVEAGLTPADALASATSVPAQIFGACCGLVAMGSGRFQGSQAQASTDRSHLRRQLCKVEKRRRGGAIENRRWKIGKQPWKKS